MTSLIPTMGPLHFSLNSREDIFETFRPFFNQVCSHLFRNSKLAKSPKPWRINLIEAVYGRRTLIRDQMLTKFQNSKDIQYDTLLNLLENYIPLVLSIYTITFKRNNFKEYFNAMIRIWVMFLCLKRRHYNKTPLVWLSNLSHWKSKYNELYEQFSTWQTIFDEYPVENTHSIIRAQTQPSDTADKLQQRAKGIFQSKTKQANFRSNFTPPKHFNYSQQQLQCLKVRCAEFLTNTFIEIRNHIGSASSFIKRKTKHFYLPHIFGEADVKSTALPLGFSTKQEPNQDCKCDLHSCTVDTDNEPWKIYQGCWHSLHVKCLNGANFCPICHGFLETKVKELGKTAQDAILHQNTTKEAQPNDISDDEPADIETLLPGNLENIDRTISELSKKIASLKPPPMPSNHHQQEQQPPTTPNSITPSTQHGRQQPLQDIQNVLNNVMEQEQPPKQQQQESTNGVIKWLFPKSICQTQIGGRPMASNACTIIASLWCRKFLVKAFAIPCNQSDIASLTSSYKQTIISGNLLY